MSPEEKVQESLKKVRDLATKDPYWKRDLQYAEQVIKNSNGGDNHEECTLAVNYLLKSSEPDVTTFFLFSTPEV